MLRLEDVVSYFQYGQKKIGMASLSILSVPDYQLFSNYDADAIKNIKTVFAQLINEFSYFKVDNTISAEIVWYCTPAINQPFMSNINLMIVFRSVEDTEFQCLNSLRNLCSAFITALNGIKVVTEYCVNNEYQSIISKVSSYDAFAIRRHDDFVGFQLGMFPACYKYDIVPIVDNDLDMLVNALINSSNCVVLVQLIPTQFNNDENMYISSCMNSLGSISKGIPMGGMGFYRDQRADVPLRTYSKYYENLNTPVISMNMIVLGESRNAMNVSSKVLSLFSDTDNSYSTALEICNIPQLCSVANNHYVSPWIALDTIMNFNRSNNFYNIPCGNAAYRLAYLYSANEVAQIFRLPIGTKKVTAGIKIHEVEKRNKSFATGVINISDILVGKLQNVIGIDEPYIGFNLKDLTKHMLVVGTPGSGKSTFLVGLMDRLWKKHNIPFLVIEPAKNEYRSLIDSIPDLQVFSPGKNNVAPFVINPFVPPKGVTIEKYKSIVKSAFSAAFEMWTPLDQLFDETLNICYSEQGWLDSDTIDNPADCFSLIDFIKVYKEVVSSKGYSGEYKKQIEAAGVLRLNGLLEQNVNIFDSRYSVPVEDVLNKPTVIELSNIKDIKQKSFIIALLLNNIYAYVESNNANDGNLKNVILLEEAHALLSGDITSSQSDGASSNASAVKLLTDMLAEIRSRGVGIVVADQSPKKVTSAVIANTNIKVMFRLVEADDKDIVQRSTVMNEIQKERLSKLRCGQSLMFYDKLDEVEEISMDDYRLNNGISTDLSDENIRNRMTYWTIEDHQKYLKPYNDCDCFEQCAKGCNLQTRECSRVIVDRIFRKYYLKKFNDFESFAAFYKNINTIIKEEVLAVFKNDELASKISFCVKVHLLRKIHYQTDIEIDFNKRKKTYELLFK